MNWHLNYSPAPSPSKISHKDKILMSGSCFAENIGEKLIANKFDCFVNPNGILFNPISVLNSLESYITNTDIRQDLFVNNNGLFHHLYYQGEYSHTNEKLLFGDLIQSQSNAHHHLKAANWLIITFGSAYVYRHLRTDTIVANCHKLPQQDFKKELLSSEQIVDAYTILFRKLKEFNPGLKIILTVSPVKYLRDGLIENNLSKAILLQSVHQLCSVIENCSYFPAYELVTDDLRDYRFYKEDMAHPNEQAINYVWEKFADTYFDTATKQLNEKLKDINNAASHRPIHSHSDAHLKFRKNYLQKCEQLEKEFPFLNLQEEKILFQT